VPYVSRVSLEREWARGGIKLGASPDSRIHPIETPGGYQMLARTLSTMQPWSDQPSKVENFDQIEFYIVEPEEFEKASVHCDNSVRY
jgi:allophanate hydrolase subunit 1